MLNELKLNKNVWIQWQILKPVVKGGEIVLVDILGCTGSPRSDWHASGGLIRRTVLFEVHSSQCSAHVSHSHMSIGWGAIAGQVDRPEAVSFCQFSLMITSTWQVGTHLEAIIALEWHSRHETNVESTEWWYRQSPIGVRHHRHHHLSIRGFSCASVRTKNCGPWAREYRPRRSSSNGLSPTIAWILVVTVLC